MFVVVTVDVVVVVVPAHVVVALFRVVVVAAPQLFGFWALHALFAKGEPFFLLLFFRSHHTQLSCPARLCLSSPLSSPSSSLSASAPPPELATA